MIFSIAIVASEPAESDPGRQLECNSQSRISNHQAERVDMPGNH